MKTQNKSQRRVEPEMIEISPDWFSGLLRYAENAQNSASKNIRGYSQFWHQDFPSLMGYINSCSHFSLTPKTSLSRKV